MALVFSVFFLFACESEADSGASLPLPAPRSIQITAKNASLVLQWTKVAPAKGVIPTYKVYYGTGSNPQNATPGDEIESNDSQLVQAAITGLTNHSTYYVWVKAVYAGLGESDYSEITYSTPIPPPAIPAGLAVTPGEKMLEVTWGAVEDAFTYEVHYKANGGASVVPPADTAETMKTVSEAGAVLLSLIDGTNYAVWVRAVNTAGESGYARAAGSPQAASGPPAPDKKPAKVTVAPGNKKLTLTWDQVSGVPQYKLYYGTTPDFSAATPVAEPVSANAPRVSAEITGLTNGTPYYVRVQSWNSQSGRENSPYSDPASGTPEAKAAIDFKAPGFELGEAAGEYIFAVDLPPSVFFPEGRPNTDRLTRVQETALANLFTDGAAWYIRNTYPDENIDFVFLNGGYIDNVLPKGKITVGTISSITQPDSRADKFFLLTLTGSQLKLFFEDADNRVDGEGDVAGVVHTGRGGPHNTGFFGIVSGEVRYTLQYYKPPEGTTEISSEDAEPYYHGFIKPGTFKINGEDIDDSRNYRICTTDYLASGEYFTRLFTDGKNKTPIDTPFWHGVAEYIYDQGIVTPSLDGRIKVEGGVPLPAPWVPGDLVKGE
jgi:hypothetical protein